MSIVLCGDLHRTRDFDKILPQNLAQAFPGVRVNYLISLGDWGAIWNDSPESLAVEKELLAQYDSFPWETLVVLGNHEGYDRIGHLPWTVRHGAPVQQASEKVFILQSGNIYTIEGLRIFAFGGADSADKDRRIKGESWWPQEIPDQADLERGLATLTAETAPIDYVVTHTCPRAMSDQFLAQGRTDRHWAHVVKAVDPTIDMLTQLEPLMGQVRGWYFGHYHEEMNFERYRCLYQTLLLLPTD